MVTGSGLQGPWCGAWGWLRVGTQMALRFLVVAP